MRWLDPSPLSTEFLQDCDGSVSIGIIYPVNSRILWVSSRVWCIWTCKTIISVDPFPTKPWSKWLVWSRHACILTISPDHCYKKFATKVWAFFKLIAYRIPRARVFVFRQLLCVLRVWNKMCLSQSLWSVDVGRHPNGYSQGGKQFSFNGWKKTELKWPIHCFGWETCHSLMNAKIFVNIWVYTKWRPVFHLLCACTINWWQVPSAWIPARPILLCCVHSLAFWIHYVA